MRTRPFTMVALALASILTVSGIASAQSPSPSSGKNAEMCAVIRRGKSFE
jgi:hypothetical protein